MALALSRLGPVEETPVAVRPRWFGHNRLLALAARPEALPAAVLLHLFYGLDAAALPRPDVILSSGRPTLLAGVLLARLYGAPFVYAGRVTGFPRTGIAVELVATPEDAGAAPRVLAPIPGLVDRRRLAPARPLASPADLDGARLSLLVGGDAPDYRFEDGDWPALAGLVRDLHARHGVRWRVSTSRRSPTGLGSAFRRLALDGVVEDFIDFETQGPGSADALMDADALVVTEDSLSMVAEALATGRPVVALQPATVRTGYGPRAVAAMAAETGLPRLGLATTGADDLAAALLAPRRDPGDPLDRIAAAIAPALGR